MNKGSSIKGVPGLYPLALENQYEKLFVNTFERFSSRLNRAVLSELKKQTRSDDSARSDAPESDILNFLEGLRDKYGDYIDQERLGKEISKNLSMIDAWSRDKTAESIGKLSLRLNTPQPPSVTGRPTPAGKSGELWMTTVKAESGMIATILDRANKRNRSLATSLFNQHYDDVRGAVAEGISKGDSFNTIAREIDRVTGVGSGRAKFWARDQASKYFGEATKVRQTEAGIPGYIWRTLKDARVRDSHSAVNGKYFSWTKPPQAGTNGKRVHPGEDFNCRCFAEPAFGPEYEDKGVSGAEAPGVKYPVKGVVHGEVAPPQIAADLKSRHKSWKRYEELKALPATEIKNKITRARQSQWKDSSLEIHNLLTDSNHDFSSFRMPLRDIASDITKRPSNIFASYWHGKKRFAFYSKFYNGIIFVDESTNKIVSLFKPSKEFLQRLVPIL